MKNTDKAPTQKTYIQPIIERVIIDNDISLALESYSGPGDEPLSELTVNYLNNNPFKTDII